MGNNNYQVYVDCGFSKLRASAFHKTNLKKRFHIKSKFFFDYKEISTEVQKMITFLEQNTNEYIDNVNLMVDSSEMLSIGISISKKIDAVQLKQDDIQFLVQEAKQQILEYYKNQNIVHIIINNYKINSVDYDYLPLNTKCNFIAIDILFICLPENTIEYYKNIFHKFDISVNQIICASYAKAKNYEEDLLVHENISFVDVGYNKTSITIYANNKISCLNVLPIGGNHITKDISKMLKIDLTQAENIKINFDNQEIFSNYRDFSLEFLQKIIFARIEEILRMCAQSIKLNSITENSFKVALMGEGLKTLNNQNKENIFIAHDLDLLEEKNQDACRAGFTLSTSLNRQEVSVVPKKLSKHGLFERFFHFFK
jgi:cell division protein FtsA|tara:strand:+ start:642 stop:1751 length:1110 start_codon:yes stop_codon:yes gene_type:complete